MLTEIKGATLVDVEDALQLLDWEDEELGARDVYWFIKLARAAIEADLGETLWWQRAVITVDGTRIVPPTTDEEGKLLLRSAADNSLAAHLGIVHVIHSAYLSRNKDKDAVVVREWLEKHEMLRDSPDSEGTLRALAARSEELEPLQVDDNQLRLMRDAFAALEEETLKELGPQVGRVIAIDVQRWRRGKRVVDKGRPADAYFPSSIEDRKDGWSKAAVKTPELTWVHPRYEKVLRQSKQRRRRQHKPKTLGARVFFSLLGTEDAPRLVEPERTETRFDDPASRISYTTLSESQREELNRVQRHVTHLKKDRLSPDLMAVLRDLQRERGLRKRRERARALLSTLERQWDHLYVHYTSAEAVWSDRKWRVAGTISATWLVHAMDEPWLTSENGKKKKPIELAVRTQATEIVLGDDCGSFAYGLDENDATSPTVRALGIRTDPEISEMVAELTELREQGGPSDEAAKQRIRVYYSLIANACKKMDPSSDEKVGDLSVRQLRARFRSKSGLIYANGHWHPPSKVFRGSPIFGYRRPFVSSTAERLWRILNVFPPKVSDCVEVLEEMARSALGEGDEQILVNTYHHLEQELDAAPNQERARLETLPLWTGGNWQKRRPVYVVASPDVGRTLSTHVAVWHLPVPAHTLPNLIAATKATLLNDDSFVPIIHEKAFADGKTLSQRFEIAVSLLRDWLTRKDPKLFEACSTKWEDLAHARIAVDAQLQLEFRAGRRTPVSAPARAHVSREPLTFYFADEEALGDEEAGGRVVALLFSEGDRDKLALAWSDSWGRAVKGERGNVSLAEDAADGDGLESLLKQVTDKRTMRRHRNAEKTQANHSRTAPEKQPHPVRRLKRIDDFSEKTVDLVETDEDGGNRKGRSRGLRDQIPAGKPIGNRKPAPKSAPRDYSDKDTEGLALQVLQLAINGDAAELRDYRHLRGIGADAFDKLSRYFEIKASYGPLPDTVTLTANEAQRAFREGDNFYLAVVAGLEEGYETVVKIVQNPLRNLEIKQNTSVLLTGVTNSKAIEVRFP